MLPTAILMPFLRKYTLIKPFLSEKNLPELQEMRPRAILMPFLRSTQQLNHFFLEKRSQSLRKAS